MNYVNYSQCIASLNELLTAATKRAEAAEAERDRLAEKWGSMVDDHGDPLDAPTIAEYVCIIREELSHMTAERDALRKDAARLDYLADESVFEGFADSPLDVYELESIVAEQNGRVDPNVSDRREAFRRVIDAALAVQP